jgi:hypothetical protein
MIVFISHEIGVSSLISSDLKNISPAQCRAGRAFVRWTAEDLARESGVGVATVRRFEAKDVEGGMTGPNRSAVRRALEAAGVVFLDGGEASASGGPGVRLRSVGGTP